MQHTTHYICLSRYLLDQEKAISDHLMVRSICSHKVILHSLSYLSGDCRMKVNYKIVSNPFMIREEQFLGSFVDFESDK